MFIYILYMDVAGIIYETNSSTLQYCLGQARRAWLAVEFSQETTGCWSCHCERSPSRLELPAQGFIGSGNGQAVMLSVQSEAKTKL